MITRCPNCSKAISESDDVCPFCGKDFTVPVKPTRPKSFAPKEEGEGKPPPKESPSAQSPPSQASPPPPPPPTPKARILEPTEWEEVTEDGIVIPPSPSQQPKPIGKNVAVAAAFLAIAFGLWRGSAYWTEKSAPASPKIEAPPPPSVKIAPQPERPVQQPSSISLVVPFEKPPAPKPRAPAKVENAPPPAKKEPLDEPVVLEHTPPSMREWGFSGAVFDLMTLKPVPDAELVFTDPGSGARFPIATDKQGLYRLVLPACSDGYDMAVSHPKYEPKYIPDGDFAFKSLPLSRRREISVESARTVQHKELFSAGPDGQLKRDMALIPLTTH
ncbi:MAG: hypothetical protein HY922_17550 [Elusimicrobia bacterium]|nr:hypothetical protein [Elusimicrobiota bacterium]